MNEKSVLQVQIYDRSIEEECFLGQCEIRPKLVNNHTVDQWFPLTARPGEDHEVTGEIRVQIRYEKADVRPPLSLSSSPSRLVDPRRGTVTDSSSHARRPRRACTRTTSTSCA